MNVGSIQTWGFSFLLRLSLQPLVLVLLLLLSCFSCVRLYAFWRGLKWSWSGSRSRWIPTMVLRGRIYRGFSASTVVFLTLPSARASGGDVLTGGSVTAAVSLTSREQRPRILSALLRGFWGRRWRGGRRAVQPGCSAHLPCGPGIRGQERAVPLTPQPSETPLETEVYAVSPTGIMAAADSKTDKPQILPDSGTHN